MDENTVDQSISTTTDESAVQDIADELQQIDAEGTSEAAEESHTGQEAATGEQVEAQSTRSERREQNYIDKLSEQIRSSNLNASRNESRTQQTEEYKPIQYEEGEYEPEQLAKDREAYGRQQYEAAMRQSQASIDPVKQQLWAQQLEFDNERVQKMWDILDESNDKSFDPDFATEMTQKYLNFIGYRADQQTGKVEIDRPNIRWVDFVKAEKQNLDRYVQRAQETSTRNIVKQAANTGIRPGAQSHTSTHKDVDTTDPNWISKLSREEWDKWGRDLADKVINERLGIK